MTAFLASAASILLLSLCGGMVRVIMGPSPSDRMMAAQLMGSTGIALLLVLAPVVLLPALVDVALIFALLAAVAVAAFTRRRQTKRGDSWS
jgi:multicomponent Na+:H+ antiporter subunit F